MRSVPYKLHTPRHADLKHSGMNCSSWFDLRCQCEIHASKCPAVKARIL